ncbi:ribosome maturation factor RimM [Pseudanabaena sp. FACHB-2040]|uniref:ribosome maturation factor RimM n=1 Tax=Pseudanabaena sp. FACHB-2040 TaxID=2692859 RepID=UPI00168905DE|nr:ribosome maturation factor RimM [Pseudanabaena sp. FACHB-2040]MBD2256452.1 ribosome maturation factor RimM [Pseudanabaena sp. FACHB-2040]
MTTESSWLEVGRIVGAQGMRGEVRIYPSSDFPERFLKPGRRWIRRANSEALEEVELVRGRDLPGKGLFVVQFKEICDRTQAENLHNATLLVPDTERPELEPGEFMVSDLIGLKVILHQSQAEIGTVVEMYAAGNDLLAVELYPTAELPTEAPADDSTELAADDSPKKPTRSPKGSKKPLPVLVPFVHEIVPVVNLEQGYVEIDPPAGLLEGY